MGTNRDKLLGRVERDPRSYGHNWGQIRVLRTCGWLSYEVAAQRVTTRILERSGRANVAEYETGNSATQHSITSTRLPPVAQNQARPCCAARDVMGRILCAKGPGAVSRLAAPEAHHRGLSCPRPHVAQHEASARAYGYMHQREPAAAPAERWRLQGCHARLLGSWVQRSRTAVHTYMHRYPGWHARYVVCMCPLRPEEAMNGLQMHRGRRMHGIVCR